MDDLFPRLAEYGVSGFFLVFLIYALKIVFDKYTEAIEKITAIVKEQTDSNRKTNEALTAIFEELKEMKHEEQAQHNKR